MQKLKKELSTPPPKNLVKNIPDEGQKLDLLNKNFKTTVLNILKKLKKTMDKKMKGKQEMMG